MTRKEHKRFQNNEMQTEKVRQEALSKKRHPERRRQPDQNKGSEETKTKQDLFIREIKLIHSNNVHYCYWN